ncbi:MAG: hypothetical protein RBR50_05455, partial [Candidatus Izemoplasmatales bacterium]|nr:hypothetical protein [Candidatus Izemoplasmatales bacterium]
MRGIKMKQNLKYLFLVSLIALGGCTTQNNDSSNTSIEPSQNITSDTLSEITSENTVTSDIVSNPPTSDSSEEVPPSSELVPLADPDVAGLKRSAEWPSSGLAAYLLYGQNIEMPIFTSEVDFHHGLYNDELFYRVMTRVRSVADFNAYKSALENNYDFNVVFEDGLYYAESMYDDVRLYLEYKVVAGRHEVSFDFF